MTFVKHLLTFISRHKAFAVADSENNVVVSAGAGGGGGAAVVVVGILLD